ncbi:hypothetical protein GCM10023264_24060 [Sphingomonas daechungensis]|uniref:D-Ala-D-Ala carboxypeptidase family metallohydrolase n=1 Tax=Sphingomonas daechungensis TaxID=1176646 RepID=UPI0031EFFCE7
MKLPACVLVLAAVATTPAIAQRAEGPSAAARQVYGAAAVAANYGSITSIYRSVAHNRAVGGVSNSYHLQGRAIDVARRPGVTHAMIATALTRAGYRMVESLDEGDHSHFAFAGPGTTVAPEQVAVAYPPPPDPTAPKPQAVRADDHGTLRIDLPPAQLASR